MATVDAKRLRGRRWFRVLVILIVLAVVIAASLLTGIPQRAGFEQGLKAGLGVEAQVEGVGVFGAVRARSLTLYDGPAERAANIPAVQVQGLRVAYNPLAYYDRDGRVIPRVQADSLSLNFVTLEDGGSSYDFIGRFLEADPPPQPSANPLLFVPREIGIGDIGLNYDVSAMGLAVRGIGIEGAIHSLGDISVRFTGDRVNGRYRVEEPALEDTFGDGKVDVRVQLDQQEVSADPLSIDLPGIVAITGEGRTRIEERTYRLELNLTECVLQTFDFPAPVFLPVPVRFTRADLSGTRIDARIAMTSAAFEESTLNAQFNELRVGHRESAWYDGDLSVTGTAQDDTVNLSATLGNGQSLQADLSGNIVYGSMRASLDDWSRDDVVSAMPAPYRGYLDVAPGLVSLSVDAEATWMMPTYEANINLAPGFEKPLPATFRVDVNGDSLADSLNTAFEGTVGDGRFSGSFDEDGGIKTMKATIDSLNPGELMRALGLAEFGETLNASVTGDIRADVAGEKTIGEVDVSLSKMPLIDYPLRDDERITVTASGSGDLNAAVAQGDRLDMVIADDGTVTLSDWFVQLDPFQVSASLRAESDLAQPAARLELGALSGEARAESGIHIGQGVWRLSPTIVVEGLAYEGVGLPYSVPADVSGEITHDSVTGEWRYADVTATAGEGTTMSLEDGSFTMGPLAIDSRASVTSDLQVLADLGLVDAASGSATADGVVGYGDTGLKIAVDKMQIEADSMELTDGVVQLTGLTATGSGQYADGFQATATFNLAQVETFGAVVSDLTGTAELSGDTVQARADGGTLYDGRIHSAELAVETVENSTAIRGGLEFRNVNLQTFSEEYEPPSTYLTGTVVGAVDFSVTDGVLKSARVRMRAPSGFSINKDLIREKLLKDTVQQATLGMMFQQTEESPGEQRHFDNANLDLRYNPETEEFQGVANFNSEELQLELPLTIDLRVITEGLRFTQRGPNDESGDVEFEPGAPGE